MGTFAGRAFGVAITLAAVHCTPAASPPQITSAWWPPAQKAQETAPHESEGPAPSVTPGMETRVRGDAAVRYARLDARDCLAELGRRNVRFHAVAATHGVRIPVRLDGPLAGVQYHSMAAPKERATSPYEVFDCRLVLALEDMSRDMAIGGVRSVTYFSAYRPPGKSETLPAGAGKRHSGALALDIASFTVDGATYVVDKDYDGELGKPPCDAAFAPRSHASFVLHDIACRAYGRGLFNVILTPNANTDHHNHFHVEVSEGVAWFYLR